MQSNPDQKERLCFRGWRDRLTAGVCGAGRTGESGIHTALQPEKGPKLEQEPPRERKMKMFTLSSTKKKVLNVDIEN